MDKISFIDKIKDKIAVEKGYPHWVDMYNWIARYRQEPGVVAQLIEAAMDEVLQEYASLKDKRIKELEKELADEQTKHCESVYELQSQLAQRDKEIERIIDMNQRLFEKKQSELAAKEKEIEGLNRVISKMFADKVDEGQDELWDNAADMIVACYNNLGSREELNVKLKSKYIISERK